MRGVRRMRVVGLTGWLTVLWVGLWHDLTIVNVLSGVLVGLAVVVVASPSWGRGGAPATSSTDPTGDDHGGTVLGALAVDDDLDRAVVRPFALLKFIGFVVWQLVQANLVLAWEILTPVNKINVGVVAVPLRTESATAMMVVANVITLTPGSMTIESIRDEGRPPTLYVNVMHLYEIEKVRAALLHVEELSVQAFGSKRARAQLTGTAVSS